MNRLARICRDVCCAPEGAMVPPRWLFSTRAQLVLRRAGDEPASVPAVVAVAMPPSSP